MLKNDLKNDIEKTLQAHCPEPPEGFAERMDNKAISLMQKKHNQNVTKGRSRYRLPVLAVAAALVLCFVTAASRDLIIRPDAIRARETATPLVTALSEGHGEVTEGEGLSQEAIEALETNFPGLADKLKPVNLSCEKQGIRMNVISALVEGNESWVVYSLQDLEGDRISRFATMDDDLTGNGDDPGYYCYLDHNQEEHKVTCVHYEEYDEPYQPVDNHLAFKVEDIGREQDVKIDILPFLEKYGKTSDGVKAPDEARAYGGTSGIIPLDSVKILDDSEPLNVSLYKDIYLTGIGWIDGKLHVRIQDRQQEKITIGSMSVYPVFLSAAGYFSETGRQCEMDQVEWSSAGDERKDLKEYIFDIRPDEVDKIELAAWADDTVDVTRDVWEVQIPADSILAESAAEQAAQEETLTTEDPVTKALREEIDNWVISSEDIVQELKPVNLSYETQGIRVDVISALVKGTELWLVYSVQDQEGDRISSYTRDSDFVCVSVNQTNYTPNDETSATLLFSEEEKKITYVRRFGFDQRIESKDGMIELEFGGFQLIHDEEVDLTEHLRQYGSRAKGVKPPDGAKGFGGYLEDESKVSWKDAKVLDSSNPLDIQVFKDIYLTGIGWTDGQMHAQFRCMDREEYTDETIPPGYLSVGIVPEFSELQSFMGYGTIEWKPDDGSNTKWIDQTINCTREEAESMKLSANVMEYVDVVKDRWTIQIPYDEIKAGSGAEACAEYELKESFNECLWWFLRSWSLGNTDYVTEAFRYDWNTDQADPEESAKEIMKAGTPGGYKIHSVSGKLGDPDCKADVSVLWQEGEGSYTCTRHELEFCLEKDENGELQYAINPEGFRNGSAAEDFPANPVLITEEDIIREVIEAHLPEVPYDEMIPISGISTEKQGIRLEAVSGCVKGNKAYMLYALQDVEGKYDGLELDAFSEWHGDDDENPGNLIRLSINRAENKSIWLYEVEKPDLLQNRNSLLTFGIDSISAWDEKDIDLTPYLKEYGKNAEGVGLPELLKFPTIPESAYPDVDKVLDYTQPLDISLWEGAKLTGIGWIDGKLHVQVHCTQETVPTDGDNEIQVIAQVNIHTPVQHQNYLPLMWVDYSYNPSYWHEHVLDVNPEDMEQSELTAYIKKQKGLMKDTWEIQVPINMLLPETGADTAVQEEAAETANPLSIEEEVNRKIEEKWPGITKELKPVNLSCEKQGIRLAVSSVVMKENKSWFVFSLEDLEGSRIKQDTGSCFNMFNLNGERNITASASWEYLYYDESKHKIAYAVCMEYDGSYQSQDNDFIVQIEAIGVSGKSQIDLLPFLKEYGNVTEGVEAPVEAVSIYDFVNRKDLKVLDYKNPLDVELGKDVYLAGIGWIDDQLHVQIYDMQPYGLEIGQMYTKPLNCSVNAFFPEQINNRPVLGDIVNLKNDLIRRDEYIFDVSPDETDNMVLYADMTEVLEVLRDNWEVRIPLESILAEGEDTTNQETAAPSV